MLTQITNIHRSKLPKVGSIGKLIMKYNRWGEPVFHMGIKSNWQCIAYNVCDSANYRFSHGIHLAYFKSLQHPKLTVKVSGFYFHEGE